MADTARLADDAPAEPRFAAHLMMFASDDAPAALRAAVCDIARCGLDGVEVPLTSDVIGSSQDVAAQARDLGLGVIASGVLPRDGDIGSESVIEQNTGVAYLRRAIDAAVAVGSPVLGGVIHQPSRVLPSDARTRQRRDRLVANLRQAVAYADQAGIRLAVEPTIRFLTSEINTVQEALELRGDVGPQLGIVLDTYHLAAEETDPVDAVARGIGAAAFIQINESTRGIFGEGTIDWARFSQTIRAARYTGWLSFEAFPRSSAWGERSFAWRNVGTAEQIVQSGFAALRHSA